MQVVWNDWDDRAGLRGYVQYDNTHTHKHTTRVTGPDFAALRNLTCTHTHPRP